MNEDEAAIRDLVEIWTRASEQGDFKTVLSLMTKDAVFMVPGREPFGREVFEAATKTPSPKMKALNELIEVQVLGDWAFTRNLITLTMTPPIGEPVRRSGYTMSLFQKDTDGHWRLARDANLMTVAT
jgi:uncharacterized protein (TIGR02246 family)